MTVTDAAGDTSQYYYDDQGLLSKRRPAGQVSLRDLQQRCNLTSITGPTGLTESFTYNSNGNLTSAPIRWARPHVHLPGPKPAGRAHRRAGKHHQLQYDGTGDLDRVQYPDSSVETATYDALGDPLTLTDPDGEVTSYTYNAAGQVASVTLADGTTMTYGYNTQAI